ncbi:hypothetical protein [Streptomyces sp. NBC_00102]|uniref:hypothetical protein n=1 Tax=Streptomyces sp. NBC_00102 TaxID=2975652 RepID=UPI002255F224|nr:hypothetical protein [Streptomyces sp. NBC_00102]MCX5400074.1 hypothetical protein [Streptomyces sp. NBC_00102]
MTIGPPISSLRGVAMERMVFAHLAYRAECQECGAETACSGVQALVGGALTWDTEIGCPACGLRLAVCGDDLPAELRDRLLAEHGAVRLRVDPAARSAVVMRVLRTALGLTLSDVRSVLDEVVTGRYVGTMPEMERLARMLRGAGVDAEAART